MVGATTVSAVVSARSQWSPPPGPDRAPRHRCGRDVVVAHIAIKAPPRRHSRVQGCHTVIHQLEELA